MKNLTNLVIKYRQDKDKKYLDEIYTELKNTIIQKAKFIYFHKYYPMNLYHKCKFCRNCDKLNNVPKSEHNLICKGCEDCKCIKGYFNLKKENLCDYKDVENDIWLEILRVVDNFDTTKDFNVYVFSCLWDFIPSFITKDFVKSLSNKSLTYQNENGEDVDTDIPDKQEETIIKFSLQEIMGVCKTKREKDLVELFMGRDKLTQEKIGKILGLSQQAISLILNKLQKRLKKL